MNEQVKDIAPHFGRYADQVTELIPGSSPTLPARLERRLNKSGRVVPGIDTPCWEWQGAKHEFGYGLLGLGARSGNRTALTVRAHRVAWILAHGPIDEGVMVLHACDNPACVRHLFLGTAKDNIHDAKRKGRMSKPPVRLGMENNKAKLSDDDKAFIMSSDLNGADVARLLGVARSTVNKIRMNGGYSGARIVVRGGSRSPRSTMSDSTVISIREMILLGYTNKEAAASFGVSEHIVSSISTGRSWSILPWPNGSAFPIDRHSRCMTRHRRGLPRLNANIGEEAAA